MVSTTLSTGNDGAATQLLDLPNELLLVILACCPIDSLLHLLSTNKRLRSLSKEVLGRGIKELDNHGLSFLSYQAGVDQTVDELLEQLEITSQSWIDCRFKRSVSQLREATGSAETFVFDANIMKCGKDGTARQLELFSLDPLEEDPVGQQAKAMIQIGSSAPKKSDTRGPIAADCYDVGQDLLAFVHARRSSAYDLDVSLYSLRSLIPHPAAIEPTLSIPSHFARGNIHSIFICGRSIALFMQDSSSVDSIILIRWRGTSIFPAIFKLGSSSEQILYMAFLDEDHPMVLTASRYTSQEESFDNVYSPLKLQLLEVNEVFGSLSNAITAYTVSYFSEGAQLLFPPLKPNAYVNQQMSWILPYHPTSPCFSLEVARQFKPSPYSEPALHAGVFMIHIGGNIGTGPGTDWQIQIVILKSDLLPWRGQPKIDVEWDNWGPDSIRVFRPRPEVNIRQVTDPQKSCFMTWVESYRAASIAFDPSTESQVFHLYDFNPNTVKQIQQTGSERGQLVVDPWVITHEDSPFLVDIETRLPFYVVEFEVTEGRVDANGEPLMVRISSTGILFERDDDATDDVIVGYCWIDDGIAPFGDSGLDVTRLNLENDT